MNEQDIPIDIHSNKLLDWLISRRHCNKDWHLHVLKIREKINNAIQDMPVHDGIVKLLSGAHINYFHCRKIVDILKETEADSKNIFGRYGSQRMKDWQEILQLYEKDNIYLAESAQILIRNVNYEVPSLRKQISKLEQSQTDCLKREKEYIKSENAARSEFNNSCKQLGISGTKVRLELIQLLDELPKIYEKISTDIKSIQPATELHSEFLKFQSSKDSDIEAMVMLKYIIQNGNTTTYEWKYGEKPVTIPGKPIQIETTNPAAANDGIDFGDDTINWDTDPTGQEIDFEITLEEPGIEVEETSTNPSNARNNDTYTLLDNPNTRNQIIDELMELESFLKTRMFEMSSDSDLLSISQMQNAAIVLQMQTPETITHMLDSVQIVLNQLISDKRTMHLHSIKHLPKYVDRLTNELEQKLQLVEKMKASRNVVVERAADYRKQIADTKPMIDLIIGKTKTLQEEIEMEVSKKYKNRTVHIIGGVNVL